MTIKAVLFDKDGTLYDFLATFAPATRLIINDLAAGDQELMTRLADAVNFNMKTCAIGPDSVLIAGSLEDISEVLMPLVGETDLEKFNARVDEMFIEYSQQTLAPFATLLPTLDRLDAMGLVLGIATNDSETAALAHLDETGITDRFSYIAGYDSGHGAKPGPGMVQAFARQLKLEPENLIMVGDSTHDCRAGRAAGAKTIAVTTGLASAKDLKEHADYILPGIAEIPDLIAELNGTGST